MREGESGRLGITFASSPTFEASDSSDVNSPSPGEEGREGEGEATDLPSTGVPTMLDLEEAVSDPPLQRRGREGKLV